MYVCICNAVTDRQIRAAIRAGDDNLWKLQRSIGVSSNCGKCRPSIIELLRNAEEPELTADTTANDGPGS